jgi:DNA-binding GntR family transcriptional regulator
VGAIADAVGLGSGETRAALGRLEADGYLVRRELGRWERTLGGGEAMPED